MKSLGIVGGGQLGRMLCDAARELGYRTVVLDPTPNSPAGQIADEQIVGDFSDAEKIYELAERVEAITFEIESANPNALQVLEGQGKRVVPSGNVLSTIKDKVVQKEFLHSSNIPTAKFCGVETVEDIIKCAERFEYPLMLKTRCGGYDGRGNMVVASVDDAARAFERLGGKDGKTLYVEGWVNFTKELAVNVTRAESGEISFHPVVETVHKNSICHDVFAPADVPEMTQDKVRSLAGRVVESLDGVGTYGIEFFLLEDERVIVNEIAPRVHNSGHHTIESCKTSQFEQHVRAVMNVTFGPATMTHPYAVMINILGDRKGPAEPKGVERALELPGVSVHIYGKHETKPERKMGHITVVGDDREEVFKTALSARALISI